MCFDSVGTNDYNNWLSNKHNYTLFLEQMPVFRANPCFGVAARAQYHGVGHQSLAKLA